MGVSGFIPSWFVGSWPWLESPSSWYGLHKVIYGTLESFSIPGVSFILAVVFFFVGLSGDQRRVTVPSPNPGHEENRDGTYPHAPPGSARGAALCNKKWCARRWA